MKGIMNKYRSTPPSGLGGIPISKVRDLEHGAPSLEGEVLPPSDVLQFFLVAGTVVSARPSGTEPKIKFYASCCSEVGEGGLAAAKAEAARKLEAINKDIRVVIGY
jgi:phosphoglucomutase